LQFALRRKHELCWEFLGGEGHGSFVCGTNKSPVAACSPGKFSFVICELRIHLELSELHQQSRIEFNSAGHAA
jgi:hypothetical protein